MRITPAYGWRHEVLVPPTEEERTASSGGTSPAELHMPVPRCELQNSAGVGEFYGFCRSTGEGGAPPLGATATADAAPAAPGATTAEAAAASVAAALTLSQMQPAAITTTTILWWISVEIDGPDRFFNFVVKRTLEDIDQLSVRLRKRFPRANIPAVGALRGSPRGFGFGRERSRSSVPVLPRQEQDLIEPFLAALRSAALSHVLHCREVVGFFTPHEESCGEGGGAPPSPHAVTAALFPTPSYFATIEALLDDVSLHSSLQRTSVTVPAGLAHVATTTVDLAVLSENKRASVSDSVVVWEFATSAFDIALSVHFNGVEVRPYARYPSHRGVVRDAFIVPHETLAASAREDGTPAPVVTFRFDNSYSRLRPKMLRYRIAVVKRSCAAAVAAGERALPLLTKMSATLLREDSASSASSSSMSTSTASSYDELSPLRS